VRGKPMECWIKHPFENAVMGQKQRSPVQNSMRAPDWTDGGDGFGKLLAHHFRIILDIILSWAIFSWIETFAQSNAAVGRQWHPVYETAGRGFRCVAPEEGPSYSS
jgi:hypothetical protein